MVASSGETTGIATTGTGATATGAGADRSAPQLSQNFSPGKLVCPQAGQSIPLPGDTGVATGGMTGNDASIVGASAGVGAGVGTSAGAGAVGSEVRSAPQLSQNASPGSTAAPHFGQDGTDTATVS